MEEVQIPGADFAVSASVHGAGPTVVVLGHGAGGSRRTRLLTELAASLASARRCAVLYNFPYTERGRRIPDPPEVLEATVRAVADYVRGSRGAARLVLGGKSMGGRIASQVVAKGFPADGLLFLGYPLHPPGRTHSLRDRHLYGIRVPMLFVQGTRDSFARWDLLERVLASLGERARVHRVEGADHSFAVSRASGRKTEEAEAEIFGTVISWLRERGL